MMTFLKFSMGGLKRLFSVTPKLRQKDEIPKRLEALSGKPVASVWKQIFPIRKLLASTNKSAGLATFAPKSEQISFEI